MNKLVAAIKKGNTSSAIASLGNTALAIVKAIGASISGSGTMYASAMHSIADAVNQGFVFAGSVLAEKKPIKRFPTGFGRVIHIFCMIAVIVVTIMAYETVQKGFKLIQSPEESTNFWLNFCILILAVIIDGAILFKAMNEILKETQVNAKGWKLIPAAFKNAGRAAPPTRLVFYEDIVATLGALFALIAIILAEVANLTLFDGIATMIIGFMMVVVAFKVGYDNMVGLIGVAAPYDVEHRVTQIIFTDEYVADISRLRITQEGRTYHVDVYIELRTGLSLTEATVIRSRIKNTLLQERDISDVTLGIIEDDGVRRWDHKKGIVH